MTSFLSVRWLAMAVALTVGCGARTSLDELEPGGASARGGSGASAGVAPSSDPCAAIVCDSAPAPSCASAQTLRISSAPGTCAGGTCAYPSVDKTCPLGCTAGACNASPKVIAVSAGERYTCAVDSTHAVKCWGMNMFGELGDGSWNDSHVPVAVTGLSDAVAVAAGEFRACALESTGTVQCWGDGITSAAIGDRSSASSVPVVVAGLSVPVRAIAAGDGAACAITMTGGLQCWGVDTLGELGDDQRAGIFSAVPVDVTGLSSGVTAISAAYGACAVLAGGSVDCWGGNESGEVGNETVSVSVPVPVAVQGLSPGVRTVAVGQEFSCAITAAGGVKCWGANNDGQLGDGTTIERHIPVDVVGLSTGVHAIAAGFGYACALTDAGGVKCWGGGSQLGNGPAIGSTVPVDVTGLRSGVVALTGGLTHACAIDSGGDVRCWGANDRGQLGDGSTTDTVAPVTVKGL
jgi:alpha-tubulin suppressor-like RCC1 family protein